MLLFLNGSTSTVQAPNENYGRELQELYTEGKGVNSLYTQTDVHNAARVLTGHTIDSNYNYVFQAGNHDDQDKQFSAFYSNTVITGYSGAAGAGEVDNLFNMLLGTQECALFICRELYNFFVYYVDDATVESDVIAPLATVFPQQRLQHRHRAFHAVQKPALLRHDLCGRLPDQEPAGLFDRRMPGVWGNPAPGLGRGGFL